MALRYLSPQNRILAVIARFKILIQLGKQIKAKCYPYIQYIFFNFLSINVQ